MANSESSFRREFKKDLEDHYKGNLKIWAHLDAARAGLPDWGSCFGGAYTPIESKFAKDVPARPTSKVLSHELTSGQNLFLRDIEVTSNCPAVLIGLPDIAVLVPYCYWPRDIDGRGMPNITLNEVMKFKELGYAFEKNRGTWQVAGFFEKLLAAYGRAPL